MLWVWPYLAFTASGFCFHWNDPDSSQTESFKTSGGVLMGQREWAGPLFLTLQYLLITFKVALLIINWAPSWEWPAHYSENWNSPQLLRKLHSQQSITYLLAFNVNFKEIGKSYNKMFMITVSEYRDCRCDRIVKSLPSKDVLILIPRTCESRIAWHEEFRLQKLINL